jgi:hypothetical protein
MKRALADGEIMREARRILRKLAAPGALLALAAEDGTYAVLARGGAKPQLKISTDLVAEFRRRDWIAPACSGDGFVLSDAGLGWLRRAMAESDPFATQHRIAARRDIVGEDGRRVSVLVNEGESPLGWLFRRKGPDGRPLISGAQFAAGEKLRTDFTLARLTPRMGVDLTAPVVAGRRGAKGDFVLPEIVLAAKQRVTRALAAVGPGLSDLLIDVCCHLKGLEAAEKEKGWPQRSAKVVLQIGLDRLAAHYGVGEVVGTGSRTRAWQAQGAITET